MEPSMNLVTTNPDGVAVTTSLAIAEGTETEHRAVLQLIRTYQSDLEEFGTSAFEMRKSGGRPTEVALLNEQQSTLLLTYMRNSDVVRGFKKALVKAFWELARLARQATLNPANLTRLQILSMAMEAEQKVQELTTQLEVVAPKAAALDRLSTADGSMCITNAAKVLQESPKNVFRRLQEDEWIYRRPGGSSWLAYQHRIQQGVLEHKVTTVSRGDGSEKVVEQVLVTPKGLARLSAMFQGGRHAHA